MITRIDKWGNSLGLRIPKQVALDADLAEGTAVLLQARNGRLVVTPVTRRRYSLDELLAGMTRSNLHDEQEFGGPVGREML